jgi:hypothetical protein
MAEIVAPVTSSSKLFDTPFTVAVSVARPCLRVTTRVWFPTTVTSATVGVSLDQAAWGVTSRLNSPEKFPVTVSRVEVSAAMGEASATMAMEVSGVKSVLRVGVAYELQPANRSDMALHRKVSLNMGFLRRWLRELSRG